MAIEGRKCAPLNMGSIILKKILIAAAACFALAVPTHAFEFTFDWGAIPKCTSGNPGRVDNPTFSLKDAPAGTAQVKFSLRDSDAPDFSHGGGTAGYAPTIAPGAFKYYSPCPPNGKHTYVWTAKALDAAGAELGAAKASQKYP